MLGCFELPQYPTAQDREAALGMSLGSVTVALMPLGPKIRKGLSSTWSSGSTSQTQTCQASQQGVGQSCRLEQAHDQADTGRPRPAHPTLQLASSGNRTVP